VLQDNKTSLMFAPDGFMKGDADYTPRPYLEWPARE
jgi:sulfide:quinone oxidoreductase